MARADDVPSDWTRRSAIVKGPIPYGSTRRFIEALRRDYPWAIVPEAEFIPLLDRPDATWNPNLEDKNISLCPLCLGTFEPVSCTYQSALILSTRVCFVGEETPRPRGCPYCLGRITRRSMLFCPKCGLTGWEEELAMQIAVAGHTAPDRTAPDEKTTRRERRRRGVDR